MDDKCNSADLAIALNSNTKIIATTIQKFPYIVENVAGLKNKRFAVIIDEAHSSTAGKDMAAVTMSLGSGEVELTEADAEDVIIDEIRRNGKQVNVSMFAFTATPKPTTLQLFGRINPHGQREAFHVYSMKQAIEEGFILDVLQNYTTYDTFYQINKEIEEDPRCKTTDAKRQIARFVELHDTNIIQRIEVIVEHFRTSVMTELGGMAKAMVITASRQGAVKYRQALEDYISKKGYTDIHALVAFSGKVKLPGDDEAEYSEPSMNGFAEDRLTKEFDKDDYNVLLVANKYQTGFDQPKLCAMYVLKKLKGVTAVQTLSRLNRICPPFEKKTFVLDFVNSYYALWEELRDLNSTIPTLNVMRRILEYYFLQLCGYEGSDLRELVLEKKENREKFIKQVEGGQPDMTDYQLASSLLAYINNPNGISDGLNYVEDCDDVDSYKRVFKLIFEALGQSQHYDMMTSKIKS